ncbi:unnamed protein product [Caenorhabditis auriculariae]|uniref:Flavin-containing monooxygenase n=1 Tax=Caenorhabditis auriculariae TaxID=2777116 RepID=A0A8S1GMD9_9PELO|nr:unnamed protein product [Caenorhabditis auriculariae]
MKRVVVVGAGAAGLAAAHHSLAESFQVDVYEQTKCVGGTWVYSEERGCHSSMYKVMKTNLPKEVMQYRDFPFKKDLSSFMSHEDVLEYLEDFSKHLPIHFESTVEKIERSACDQYWTVTVCKKDEEPQQLNYDVVFVCNGHYFEPRNPFADSNFKGTLIHSHDYRKASEFAGKDVAVVGAGPSGIDIALQLSSVCHNVTMISRKATYPRLPPNVKQLASHVKEVTSDGVVTDEDETVLVDAIIVCTGYAMKFPFLSDDLVQLKADNQMVSPLYEHVVHVDYPDSLFFIGLNLVAITFPLFEYQVKMALGFVTGRAPIPEKEKLQSWENEQLEHQATRGLDQRFYHLLQAEQWDYMARLSRIGRFEDWDYLQTMKKIFDYLFSERRENVVGYKNIDFVLNENLTDFRVKRV